MIRAHWQLVQLMALTIALLAAGFVTVGGLAQVLVVIRLPLVLCLGVEVLYLGICARRVEHRTAATIVTAPLHERMR